MKDHLIKQVTELAQLIADAREQYTGQANSEAISDALQSLDYVLMCLDDLE